MKKLNPKEINNLFGRGHISKDSGREIEALEIGEGLLMKFEEWPFNVMGISPLNEFHKRKKTGKRFSSLIQRHNGVILIKRNS